MARDVKIAILGDASSIKRAMHDAERATTGFGDKLDAFDKKASRSFAGIGLAAGAAGAGIALFGKQVFDAYASLETQTVATDKAFGRSAGKVKAFAKTTAKSLGITETESLQSAAAFGDLFKSLSLTEDQAADMSASLISAAGDMAMLRGADPTLVLETVSAAFRGEYDSLQRFLPTISDAAIKQQALAMTGKASADQLTAQDKAMATFALITMPQFNSAIGSAGSLLGTSAGQAATLGAKMEETKAKLGSAFVPFINDTVLPALNAFADWFGKWWENNGDDFKKGIDEAKAKFTEMKDSAHASSDDMRRGIALVITEFNKLTGMGSTDPNENLAGLNDLSDNWNLMMEDWKNGLADLTDRWQAWVDLSVNTWNNAHSAFGRVFESIGWAVTGIKDTLLSIRDVIADIIKMTPVGGTMSFIENALGIDIPGFDTGGVVPGPRGAPRLVMAHGGETVLPTHKRGVTVNQTVNASGMTPGQAVQLITAYERMALAGVA